MATPSDLSRLNAHLRQLVEVIYAAVTAEAGSWAAAVLDARYTDESGGFIYKIRVERADGSLGYALLPAAGSLQLIELGQARPTGPDRWHGLVLRVTAERECETKFNYDPTCAEDATFFES